MAELDLNDVAMFVRVVEHAGFAPAARELGVPTSTPSRAVARLESAAGTRLVHRNTRSVTPTSEGRAFYAEVAPALLALRQAARSMEGHAEGPRGLLRVSAPNDLGATLVAQLVNAFVERYPLVSVSVELSARTVDLVREGCDVALRASERLGDSSLVARKAGELEAGLYAAPSYLSLRGAPPDIAGLDAHECVLFRPKRGEATWVLEGPDGSVQRRVRGRVGGDDFLFVRAVALGGGGIALLPRMVAAQDVAAGRLVRVLPELTARGAALYVVHAAARAVPAKVRAFRDFVLQSCSVRSSARGSRPPGSAPAPRARRHTQGPNARATAEPSADE